MIMPKKWYDELVQLCYIQSHSLNEKFMVIYLIQWIEENNLDWTIDNVGNLIVTKGKVKTYPCIVSHMDTVHKCLSNYTVYNSTLHKQKILYAKSNDKETGIGGDDKCGIFACLFFLKTLPAVKIVFFTQEENGCKGSNGIDLQFFRDCRYIIQLDRREAHDFIDSKYDQKIVSHQFSSEIGLIKKKYKFKSSQGTITDSVNLFNRGVDISCVNISSGYYKPHTSGEYIVVDELWNSILFTQEIIKTLKPKIYEHKKKEIKYNWQSNTNNQSAWKKCELCQKWKHSILDYQLINNKAYCYDCLKKCPNYHKCNDCNKYVETSKTIVVPKMSKDNKQIGSDMICKLCDSKRKNKDNKDTKSCSICEKRFFIKHGHENVVATFYKGGTTVKRSYDFVCYICYHTLNTDKTPIDDWIECSVCRLATDPMFGKQDGEIFTCNDCLAKEKQYSAYCEICNKEFTVNINDYDNTEFICPDCKNDNTTSIIKIVGKKCSICKYVITSLKGSYYNPTYDSYICADCVANYTEKCTICDRPTPIDLGNYVKGEFLCITCIVHSAKS